MSALGQSHSPSYYPDRRWKSHPNGLKDLAANSSTFTAQRQTFAIVFNGDLLQRRKILFDMGPFEDVTGRWGVKSLFLTKHNASISSIWSNQSETSETSEKSEKCLWFIWCIPSISSIRLNNCQTTGNGLWAIGDRK